MKQTQIIEYISALLNNPEPQPEIIAEIQNSILLLLVYKAGLAGEDFPISKLIEELDIEIEIPVDFHMLLAQIAILISKKGDSRARGFLYKSVQNLLSDYEMFFNTRIIDDTISSLTK